MEYSKEAPVETLLILWGDQSAVHMELAVLGIKQLAWAVGLILCP